MCASHFRHFRRLRRDRRSLQEFEASKTEILAKMLDGRRSRDHQDIGRPLEKPNERNNLHGRGTETRSDVRQGSRLEWSEPVRVERMARRR